MTNSSNVLHGYHIINPTASLLNFDQIMKMMNRLGVESAPFITNTKRVRLYLRNPRQTHSDSTNCLTFFLFRDYIYVEKVNRIWWLSIWVEFRRVSRKKRSKLEGKNNCIILLILSSIHGKSLWVSSVEVYYSDGKHKNKEYDVSKHFVGSRMKSKDFI